MVPSSYIKSVLEEIFEFTSESNNFDEFMDVIGYFTPTVQSQFLITETQMTFATIALNSLASFILRDDLLFARVSSFLLALSNPDHVGHSCAHSKIDAWYLKNANRGRRVIPREEINTALKLFSQQLSFGN